MARPLRIEYPGALYHVVSRGNGHQPIFTDKIDYQGFLSWIKEALELHNLNVFAFCLMGNHYHLLVETPDANLAQAMRDINGNYTQWFNARHKTVGHLFQGRYKSFVIEKEIYLLEVARYIVLNPVRAGLVKHPRQYRWSSYRPTAETNQTWSWLNTNWLIDIFDNDKQTAQKEYRKFIMNGFDAENPHNHAANGYLLGSPQFIHWIWETQTNGFEEIKEHTREQRIVGRPTLEEIFQDVKTKEDRNSAIIFARVRCGYPATEIARYVDLSPSVVGRISRGIYR